MPDPSLLTPLGVQMRDSLPPRLRGSIDYLAVVHACAREVELLDATMEIVRAQFNPATADVLLSAWEVEVKLPVGGNSASVPQRRAAIAARIRKLLGQSEGREWEQTITKILGPSWSYEEHDPAVPGSPTDGIIRITIPFASGTSRFIEAQNQIREVTPAHLEVDFVSTTPFHLDSSEMDVQQFGA